jgi:hypothetical protein
LTEILPSFFLPFSSNSAIFPLGGNQFPHSNKSEENWAFYNFALLGGVARQTECFCGLLDIIGATL